MASIITPAPDATETLSATPLDAASTGYVAAPKFTDLLARLNSRKGARDDERRELAKRGILRASVDIAGLVAGNDRQDFFGDDADGPFRVTVPVATMAQTRVERIALLAEAPHPAVEAAAVRHNTAMDAHDRAAHRQREARGMDFYKTTRDLATEADDAAAAAAPAAGFQSNVDLITAITNPGADRDPSPRAPSRGASMGGLAAAALATDRFKRGSSRRRTRRCPTRRT
jgi:hypothetical protein